jgi:universal stress protein A
MNNYQHILVAIDFSKHSERALQRAVELAARYHAHISLLHVTEMPFYPMEEGYDTLGVMMPVDMDVTDELLALAQDRLAKLAQKNGAGDVEQNVVLGTIKIDIIEQAESQKADLIVMGRHGMSGMKALMGSVTDSVMHAAKCDVLAVTLDD